MIYKSGRKISAKFPPSENVLRERTMIWNETFGGGKVEGFDARKSFKNCDLSTLKDSVFARCIYIY